MTTATSPLVSVAIPVFNGCPYLAETISSVLSQDYPNIELIITDNASTDDTEAVCREFAARDPRVRYVRNPQNLGAGPNHNLGFRLSRGEFFKWCAADDLISKTFVSACVEALLRQPDAVLAASSVQSIDDEGRAIPLVGRGMTPHDPHDRATARFFKDLLDRVTCTNFEVFGLIRSSVLRKTCLQPSYYGADQMLVTELTLHGPFAQAPEAILYNREHPGRSMRIRDPDQLLRWQDARATGKAKAQNRYRLEHLLKIAFRQENPLRTVHLLWLIAVWVALKAQDHIASRWIVNGKRQMDGALV